MQIHFPDTLPAGTDTVRLLTREGAAGFPHLPAAEFGGREMAVVFLHAERQLLAGVGPAAELGAGSVRAAAGAAARWLRKNGRTAAAFDLGSLPAERAAEWIRAAVEGALLGAYRFDRFQVPAEDDPAPTALETLSFVTGGSEAARVAGARAVAGAEAANHARELGNSPPNTFFPETLADAARKLAAESDGRLTVEVFEPERLRAEGFGGLLAVGGGSAHGPRLIVVRYAGGGADEAPLVFVGKAVTFDSGGLSIKPAAGMEEMVWDKCGGCAALAAMQAVAVRRPARNVVAVIASAENLTGPGAYRPGDVVTVFDGRHIEINNTDAEGRVILADALGYARKVLRAARIVDLATLTGGCVVALGDDTAGLWANDEPWKSEVLAAAGRAGEAMWPMPITREHEIKIKSPIALIKNSSGRPGSPCTAAAFLRTFVGDTPWAHIDLAGPAATTEDRPELARGATGFGVRTLVELACA